MSSGATTAIGTPKPAMPCRNDAKTPEAEHDEEVDGKNVTADMTFVDFRPDADSEGTPGSLEATCD